MNTDNASVIDDILHAALAMPPDLAATVAPLISRAAQAGTFWIDLANASDLCVRLADGGQVTSAVSLAQALLSPKFGKARGKPGRRDEYWYKEGLKKVAPVLSRQQPRVFLPLMCSWLSRSIRSTKHVSPDSGSDQSYMWRPAIEEHEQNRNHDLAGVLVGFLREAFEQAVREARISLEEAIEIITSHGYLVFRRIRVHLINEFADKNVELARQVMMDQDLFDDFRFKHEYAMLVGRRLNLLTPEERNTWFGWINAGPDMSDFSNNVNANTGRTPTEQDRQNRIHHWQFAKLHWVRDHLQGKRREFYERMLSEYGEPPLADLNFRFTSRWGHDSPMTVEDLNKMPFEQAVDTVSSWRPLGSSLTEPTIEGLATTFQEYIKANPEAFSSRANVLIGRPAIYVRGFISRMREAAKTGRDIDVPSVLNLCQWVVERPVDERTTAEGRIDDLVDKDWQWTRDEISELVQIICKAESGEVPRYPLQGLREPLWQLVESLYRAPGKSYIVRDMSKDDPRVHDYLELGINSPRGKAVEAGLDYARWVAEHIKEADGKQGVVPGGFDAVPEVRRMLEWQIAPDNRTVETLSVIGSSIWLIHWMDKIWLASKADQLFHLEGIDDTPAAPQGWAAWNAFLLWTRPHADFYTMFRPQFAYAVDQAAKVQLTEDTREQPMNSLGEHLIVLYGRGQLGLDDDGGLLRRFLNGANVDTRRHAITFVGNSLSADQELPEGVAERFMSLWTLYWESKGKGDAHEVRDASLFGAWFASGQFPELWSLERLEEFVSVSPTLDHTAMERLAEITHVDVTRCMRILDQVARSDKEGWRPHGWLEPAKQILKEAMKIPGEARALAEALINHLGRRGYTDLGELLRE